MAAPTSSVPRQTHLPTLQLNFPTGFHLWRDAEESGGFLRSDRGGVGSAEASGAPSPLPSPAPSEAFPQDASHNVSLGLDDRRGLHLFRSPQIGHGSSH